MFLKIYNIENEFNLDNKYWLIIENIEFFRETISNFMNKNEEKIFLYSNNVDFDNNLRLMKTINNYFDIDLNEKSFLTEFIKKNKFNQDFEIQEIESNILELFDSIIAISKTKSPVDIEYEPELTLEQLFKLFRLSFSKGNNEREKFINYCKLLVEFSKIEIIVAINLNNYFSCTEIIEIYEEMRTLNVILFVIGTYYK